MYLEIIHPPYKQEAVKIYLERHRDGGGRLSNFESHLPVAWKNDRLGGREAEIDNVTQLLGV